ncbi:MAG: proton-conducting transporter membrane subunit [Candidatus Omnitrophota bacterium]|nr:proton-conducting transporter membrane subunit [Candidatus Omnitrophota bacterium]
MSLISYLVIIPLAAGFFIPIFGKRVKSFGGIIAVAATSALFLLTLYIAQMVRVSKMLTYSLGKWSAPVGISMVVDGLSCFMLVIVNMIALLIAIYSTEYMKRYTDTWKFFSLFALMVAGMNGVLISGDLFNLYVFLEIAAIAAYSLVAFGVEAPDLEASFKYAVMGAVGSSFIVLGIAFVYSHASTLNMADIALSMSGAGADRVALFAGALFLMGFGLKAALVPFHAWLPDAYSRAPAPVSAAMAGLVGKALGIYVISRIFFNVFGMSAKISAILIALAVASMLVGSLMAFGQTGIKRLLAYSSISQIGYVMLGIGVGTPLAIMGGLFHLFNHSIFKSLLFLNAGAIKKIAGTGNLKRMPGILAKSPLVGYTNLIGSMSVCGIPPLGGFWSKIIIIFACIQAGRPVLAFVATAVGILTIGYYFKAVTPILFGSGQENAAKILEKKRISLAVALPMVILAALSIFSVLLLMPNIGRSFLGDAIAVLVRGREYASLLMGYVK